MTNLKLAIVAMLLSANVATSAIAQSIDIRITDKEGAPRRNLNLEYDINGIDVDRLDSPPVPLIAQRIGRTDSNGVLQVDTSNLTALLSQYRAQLANSRQIQIVLSPLSSEEELAAIQLDFLLGTEPQDLKVVIMKSPFAEAAAKFAKAAYRGKRSTFHLLGDTGTAFYCQRGGSYALAAIEFSREDLQFAFYREPESGRNWAFEVDPKNWTA